MVDVVVLENYIISTVQVARHGWKCHWKNIIPSSSLWIKSKQTDRQTMQGYKDT